MTTNLVMNVAKSALSAAVKNPSAAKRVAQLTQALPTMTMSFGSQEVSALAGLAEKSKACKDFAGFFEKLLGESGTLTVQTAKTAGNAGKSVTLAVSEAGTTVAKLEAQPSFLERLAQVIDDIRKEGIQNAIKNAKKVAQLTPEETNKKVILQMQKTISDFTRKTMPTKATKSVVSTATTSAKGADHLLNPSTGKPLWEALDPATYKKVIQESEEYASMLGKLGKLKKSGFDFSKLKPTDKAVFDKALAEIKELEKNVVDCSKIKSLSKDEVNAIMAKITELQKTATASTTTAKAVKSVVYTSDEYRTLAQHYRKLQDIKAALADGVVHQRNSKYFDLISRNV